MIIKNRPVTESIHRYILPKINILRNKIGLIKSVAIQILFPESKRESYAKNKGFFWLNCPQCNALFGGQECKYSHSIKLQDDKGDTSDCLCPKCSYKIDGDHSSKRWSSY